MNNTTLGGTLSSALAYLEAGFSVIPIELGGSKKSAVLWKQYQQERATAQQLESWFEASAGIGIVCGAVSGNLEVLDFDSFSTAVSFFEGLEAAGLSGLVQRMWRVLTPSYGTHLYYRNSVAPEGNAKLAMSEDGKKVLIETRGEGGYVVAPGSPKGVHVANRAYRTLSHANGFQSLPALTAEERQRLLEYARSFDKRVRPEFAIKPVELKPVMARTRERAGDAFNRQATWADVLLPHGWQLVRTDAGGQSFWRRPEGKPLSWGATSNGDGTDRLFVFTSSTVLPTNMPLDKFTVYAWLNFGGSHAEAAKQLARRGFGEFMRREVA